MIREAKYQLAKQGYEMYGSGPSVEIVKKDYTKGLKIDWGCTKRG